MRTLAALPDDGQTAAWQTLVNVASQYSNWIQSKREEVEDLPADFQSVANRHLTAAASGLDRINRGIEILRSDKHAREAFRLANLAMLLQQIATKTTDQSTTSLGSSCGHHHARGRSSVTLDHLFAEPRKETIWALGERSKSRSC